MAIRNPTILVVDDDDQVLETADGVLKDGGYEVVAAGNGVDALLNLYADSSIKLLLADVVMPGGMDGLVLAQRAKEMRPDLKVIYMSGYMTGLVSGQAVPSATFLAKPWAPEQLEITVRTVLGH
jgi:DNA-binding NtrC family response regulator